VRREAGGGGRRGAARSRPAFRPAPPGEAKADAYRQGIAAVGPEGFTAIQIAGLLAEHGVRLVPDIAVSGDGASGGLATAMLGRVLAGTSRVENGK
jgi:hypothetical protein